MPFVLSTNNLLKTVYLLSFDDLSMYTLQQKEFSFDNQTTIDLKPTNANEYEIIFENLILWDILID